MLLPQLDPPDILRRLGFRCVEPQRFTLRNGTVVTVHASGWILRDKTLSATEAEARCLRLYTVYYPEGGTEELDEHDVAFLVGAGTWEARGV
jgi:hypothetical protein